jgi:hypothetical protein
MPRHVGVGPVDHRLVERGLGDAGLQIVADRLPCGAAEIGEGADVRGDPVRQLLAPGRLGVREAGGAEHRDDGRSKLTERDVEMIRSSPLSGVQLAQAFGVAPSVISGIRRGRSWKHVT